MRPDQNCILLTGGTGFLGSHLLASLVAKNYKVILLKRSTSSLHRIANLTDRVKMVDIEKVGPSLVRVFEENKIHTILHCATNYGRTSQPFLQVLEANLMLPLFLMEQARHFGVRAFINTDTILDKRINIYSLSKRHFAEWLNFFSSEMVCANVVLEHFYGFKDDPSKFVTKIIHSLLRGDDSIDLTLGEQKRDFVYIDDVISAFEKVIQFSESSAPGFHRFEVGSGKSIRIREFVELVKSLSGNQVTRLDFGKLPYRENEIMDSRVDISSLTQLGWKPSVLLQEGLLNTINIERSNLNL